MKQDWTEQMRKKLEGHEQTPPVGLWESVSEQMGLAPTPVRRKVIPFRWWWGVAAAIVVALGVGLYHRSGGTPLPAPPRGRAVAEAKETPPPTLVDKDEPVRQTLAVEPQTATHSIAERTKLATHSKAERTELAKESEAEKEELVIHSEAERTELAKESAAEEAEPAKDSEAEEAKPVREADPTPIITDRLLAEATGKADSAQALPLRGAGRGVSKGHFSISMAGSGGLLAAQSQLREGRVYYSMPSDYHSAPSTTGTTPTFYSLTDYASKHHLPVCFGLNLQWHVHPRLAITTGLHYTYLHSEISIPLYDYTLRTQHLHYLGLPLGLSARLWGNRHFQVYATAGAMLEKCLNDEPWQWSVNVAAGAEYMFHRHVGLYAEPSLGYFFDDGTQLQHYYKQHPWAPSIEVGLRVHVGK